jgi:predicted membrane-bound spermidine synthase
VVISLHSVLYRLATGVYIQPLASFLWWERMLGLLNALSAAAVFHTYTEQFVALVASILKGSARILPSG